MNPFSEVACGSCFAYSARESSEIARRSRQLRNALKDGQERAVEWVAERAAYHAESDGVKNFLGNEITLVPVPGLAPWRGEQHRWIGLLLARALHRIGLAHRVALLVSRTQGIRRSKISGPGDRPTHRDHYESFAVSTMVDTVSTRITVVDDSFGRGSTIMGAVARLRERFPTADIRGFAALRVKSDFGNGPIIAPCRHRIWVGPNGVRRSP